jgi:hypothetical protein
VDQLFSHEGAKQAKRSCLSSSCEDPARSLSLSSVKKPRRRSG